MKHSFLKTFLAIGCVAVAFSFFAYDKTSASGAASCPSLPTNTGSAIGLVHLGAGNYTVWSRMRVPAVGNSYYLQVGQDCAVQVSDNMAANSWDWVARPQKFVAASDADYSVVMTGNETGVGVDKIMFVADNCVPTGDGSNCIAVATEVPTLEPIATATLEPTAIPTLQPTATPIPTLALPTNTPVPADAVSPMVSIISPVNGSTVARNSKVTISASASDNVGVSRVEFSVNGSLLCSDTTAPYSCIWSVPGKKNATYSLKATAFDAAGNSAISSVSVTAR